MGKPVDQKTMPGRNGGTLMRGGYHGGGRPKAEIRRSLREVFDKGIPEIERIMLEGEKEADRIRAMELAGKYGVGAPKVGYDEELVDELAKLCAESIHGFLEPADADELIDEIAGKWVRVLAKKKLES